MRFSLSPAKPAPRLGRDRPVAAMLGFYASCGLGQCSGGASLSSRSRRIRAGPRHPPRCTSAFPKEIKVLEHRVGLTPESVREARTHGHDVIVETRAGQGIGMDDDAYRRAGATIAATAAEVFARADMIVKVKEPQAVERAMLAPRPGAVHLSASGARSGAGARSVASGAVCIAYETVTSTSGGLPLLAPMSEVAGRMSIQAGAYFLEKAHGGLGVLLGGVPGVDPAKVVILGGGVVGSHACHIALGMGAEVWVLDRNTDVLRALWRQFGRPLNTVFSTARCDRAPRHQCRSGRRRRADSRRVGAEAGVGRAGEADEAGLGDRRRGDRPGRLLRDVAADDARRSDLCRRRRHPLLRGQHARRRAAHVDVRAQQCDACRSCSRWPTRAIDARWPTIRISRNGLNVAFGKVTCRPVAEALGYAYTEPAAALA